MSGLPRLAIFYDSSSAPLFELVNAARDLCQPIWLVGWSGEEPPLRLLSRFGEVLDLSGLDVPVMIDIIVASEPDGIAVFNDPPIQIAAEVAQRANLPFHSPSTARLLTDKLAQREALRDAGVQVPRFAPVNSSHVDDEVPFPAVLKPRVGAGSRDTFRVESSDEVAAALAKCPPREEFILEELLPDRSASTSSADIVSVESIASKGHFQHVMVTGRFTFAPPFRERGSFLPSDLTEMECESVKTLADAAVRALGIELGVLHTEIKMTPDGPRLIEVNGRLGGVIDSLITRLGAPSLTAWAMALALGLDPGPYPNVTDSSVAYFRLIVGPPNAIRVESVEGVSALSELPGVEAVESRRQSGDALDTQKGYTGYVLKIDGAVGSHAELFALMERIDSTLTMTWSFE